MENNYVFSKYMIEINGKTGWYCKTCNVDADNRCLHSTRKEFVVDDIDRAALLPSGLKQIGEVDVKEEMPVIKKTGRYVFVNKNTGHHIYAPRYWEYAERYDDKSTIYRANDMTVGTYNGLLSLVECPIIIKEI